MDAGEQQKTGHAGFVNRRSYARSHSCCAMSLDYQSHRTYDLCERLLGASYGLQDTGKG